MCFGKFVILSFCHFVVINFMLQKIYLNLSGFTLNGLKVSMRFMKLESALKVLVC